MAERGPAVGTLNVDAAIMLFHHIRMLALHSPCCCCVPVLDPGRHHTGCLQCHVCRQLPHDHQPLQQCRSGQCQHAAAARRTGVSRAASEHHHQALSTRHCESSAGKGWLCRPLGPAQQQHQQQRTLQPCQHQQRQQQQQWPRLHLCQQQWPAGNSRAVGALASRSWPSRWCHKWSQQQCAGQ